MAGSYNHVIDDKGNLISPERMAGMLENGGDVYEAVEEMYGMIWWLATLASKVNYYPPEVLVNQARDRYATGLELAKRNENKQKES